MIFQTSRFLSLLFLIALAWPAQSQNSPLENMDIDTMLNLTQMMASHEELKGHLLVMELDKKQSEIRMAELQPLVEKGAVARKTLEDVQFNHDIQLSKSKEIEAQAESIKYAIEMQKLASKFNGGGDPSQGDIDLIMEKIKSYQKAHLAALKAKLEAQEKTHAYAEYQLNKAKKLNGSITEVRKRELRVNVQKAQIQVASLKRQVKVFEESGLIPQ